MREMHRWGAHAMVITVWLHMFRVFMTGSYKPPREFNWSVGVVMLVLTLLLSFTGYLLPWDQLAIWAITVGSNMARATPFLGHEGPGASLLRLGDVPRKTMRGSRCSAARLWAKPRCCGSTCCTASACRSGLRC
jgi:quinol-cytochrome oxidoreductase complex cytochrome b subunit